ncbi:hypothetical protein ebA1358 [Aromatoleum aromaticum EbN1]|uniref:Uncharacterized protein n=1 Tax=Aromatoleum aromaticum (strain DSM 19018 / LMG 30748 / EbN1) TaxID=76114 RepID=Q5P750_AROAE|nr:hypothetical protein ebA1358 [Aromatoleum aromaticum EbN1]
MPRQPGKGTRFSSRRSRRGRAQVFSGHAARCACLTQPPQSAARRPPRPPPPLARPAAAVQRSRPRHGRLRRSCRRPRQGRPGTQRPYRRAQGSRSRCPAWFRRACRSGISWFLPRRKVRHPQGGIRFINSHDDALAVVLVVGIDDMQRPCSRVAQP